jgi:ParB family chromosome partitioning protein
LDDAPLRSEEAPRMALDLIDEDPDQPRTEFDPVALQELADNIQASGGVKSPVSLRPHPTLPGRYMLNFGARRLRASRLLGLPDIPYFMDRQVDSFDQVAENEQRDGLTAMELALFIKKQLDNGLKQRDIAHRLGKSEGFISRAMAFIDAPDCVVLAYREGRLRGGTEAYELRKLHAEKPAEVEAWIAQAQDVTRTAIVAFKALLDAPVPAASNTDASEKTFAAKVLDQPQSVKPLNSAQAPVNGQTASSTPAARVLMAEYKGQPLVLDASAEPPREGHVFGRRPRSTKRLTVPAAEVRLVGFADAQA